MRESSAIGWSDVLRLRWELEAMGQNGKTIRIGFYGSGWDEISERPFNGVVKAVSEDPCLNLFDCRLSEMGDDFTAHPPPWTGHVDGTIIATGLGGAKGPEEVVDWIAQGGVPAVSINADVLHPRLPTVCLDTGSIAKLAAQHLIDCGCRRFLHVGFAGSMGSLRRAGSFREKLAKHGFELQSYDFMAKVEERGEDPASPVDVKALGSLLRKKQHPVGVLAIGDPFARALWRVCDELEINVPEQVKIVGVNNLPVAFAQRPTITSVHYPGEEVGYRAAQLLVKLIRGGRKPRKPIGVPATKITGRESTLGEVASDDSFSMALKVIKRQACHGLRTQDLADMLAVSLKWLELEFRKRLGRTPLQEINRVRLATARKLLQTTELPVNQVAFMLGFAENSGLTHFFRKHTSLSPTEYREWLQQQSSADD